MSGYAKFFQKMAQVISAPHNEHLSERELSDLGLSRADLAMLRSGAPRARERIVAMAEQFGLTEADLSAHSELGLELAEKCGHCLQAETCRDAIRAGVALPDTKCPNAEIYRVLAQG
ncbi:hypothetical protein J7426_13685 [Tropicibacter sp. R16_0]|uniref:hypothetical protein n=1 Tax=Tropicibacter sp. R16_0 TaxID=2821102 RepID=UPI001ADC5AFE|nr:hypothetical protein [Tropicibacter sp. R16_0]MBO9451318.1 hypothetical protein [Tropicibacter sp. R16_0]